jgi:hypothetical protein
LCDAVERGVHPIPDLRRDRKRGNEAAKPCQ